MLAWFGVGLLLILLVAALNLVWPLWLAGTGEAVDDAKQRLGAAAEWTRRTVSDTAPSTVADKGRTAMGLMADRIGAAVTSTRDTVRRAGPAGRGAPPAVCGSDCGHPRCGGAWSCLGPCFTATRAACRGPTGSSAIAHELPVVPPAGDRLSN